MTMTHLDLNDIVDYIYCERLDPQAAKLAQKVNSHILTCEQCRKTYDVINDIHKLVKYKRVGKVERDHEWNTLASICVVNQMRLVANMIAGCSYYFNNPMQIGARGSSDDGSVDTSMLVDEDDSMNSMNIKEGTLSVCLAADNLTNAEPKICLLDKEGKVVTVETMELQNEVYCKDIAVADGEYTILVG